jgi:choline kinase
MRSIILTAERGDRLRPITGNRPKCLATGWQAVPSSNTSSARCAPAASQASPSSPANRYEDALLVAFRGRNEQYSDEETKLRVRNGRVTEISKSLRTGDANGERLGIAKFGATGARLIEEMERLVAAAAIKDWAPFAFAGFCQRRPLHVVDHRGLPWIEIDFPNDYWRACTHIALVLDDAVPAAGTVVRRAADHV